jgi:hypothetical protein
MSSETSTGTLAPRRNRTVVVAFWILGAIALAELVAASIALAPKIASNVRQQPPSVTPSSAPNPQAIPGEGTQQPSEQGMPTSPARQNPGDPLQGSLPFRQPPPDSVTAGSVPIQILHARLEGSENGSKTLRIAIKVNSRQPVESSQVKVQVYFYDESSGEIAPSKAQVTSTWISWKEGEPGLLEVKYLPETIDPEVRFAGYLIAVYYKGDLQDCRSDPPRLKKLFEPKYFIGTDEP